MRHVVLTAALLLGGCALAVRSDKREVVASLSERNAEMAAFERWSLSRQTAIMDRCEQQIRSPVAGAVVTVEDCERRINRFRATRDEALKLFKGEAKTLHLVLGLVNDENGGAQ